MKLKKILCRHKWNTYYFNCQRSCIKCKSIESAGYTSDDDDWHPTHDHDVKKALRHFVIKILTGRLED